MEAKFAKLDGILVVELKGRLDFETAEPFRRTCMQNLLSEKVVFDLKNLNFVGSLGLKDFVETLENMRQQSGAGVKFCGLSSEFRRLFEASGIIHDHVFETRERAIQSFSVQLQTTFLEEKFQP